MSTKCRSILFLIGTIIIIILITMISLFIQHSGMIQPYFQLKGKQNITISYTKEYEEEGFIARSFFRNENEKVQVKHLKINDQKEEIHYMYEGHTYIRTIQKIDDQKPKITLKGEDTIILFLNEAYEELGVSAKDEMDGDLSHQIKITSNIKNQQGNYEVIYQVKDQSGNESIKKRKVIVLEDPMQQQLHYQHDAYENKYEEWWFEKSKDHQRMNAARTNTFLQKYHAYYQGIDDKVIYLTFDEGGNDVTYIKEIAKILDQYNIKASFFVTANYLQAEAKWIKEMVNHGHDILNHSVHHKDMSQLAHQQRVKEFVYEIKKWEQDYLKITGKKSKPYFRFPKGGFSERSLKMVSDLGYHTFFWSHAFYDYGNDLRKEEAFASMMDYYHPGAIYLLHPSNKGNYEALETFIQQMLEKGYRFALLDEICKLDKK